MFRDVHGFHRFGRIATPPDTTPPTVLTVATSNVVTDPQTQREITWTLDEFATGHVEWGTTTAYGSTNYPAEMSFDWDHHTQVITGLSPGTLYHFRVYGQDAAGNRYVSADQTFTTEGTSGVTPGFAGLIAMGSSLNNLRVGYGLADYAYRFKAKSTGSISSVRFYWLDETAPTGYQAGDGGMYKMSLQACDANGFPDGVEIASVSNVDPSYYAGVNVAFTSPGAVTAGQRYCIVWENIHADPANNYGSLDSIWKGGGSEPFGADHQGATWADLAILRRAGSAWDDSTWDGEGWVPIFDLTYADASHQGYGYVNSFTHDSMRKIVTGTNDIARIRIVPSSTITVSAINVASLRANTGTDPLKVDLQDSTETTIEAGTIPAADFPVYTGQANQMTPVYGRLALATPRVLTQAVTYYIEFSVNGGGTTQYKFAGMRRGKDYGYDPSTYWNDSDSYESADGGSTWLNPLVWGNRSVDQVEWMVYLETQA